MRARAGACHGCAERGPSSFDPPPLPITRLVHRRLQGCDPHPSPLPPGPPLAHPPALPPPGLPQRRLKGSDLLQRLELDRRFVLYFHTTLTWQGAAGANGTGGNGTGGNGGSNGSAGAAAAAGRPPAQGSISAKADVQVGGRGGRVGWLASGWAGRQAVTRAARRLPGLFGRALARLRCA